MSKNRTSRANVFLIELVVAIAVFALASSILLQVFVQADALSREAARLSGAILAAENAAEQLRAQPAEEEADFSFWYDLDWQPSGEEEGAYRVLCRPVKRETLAGALMEYSVTVLERDGGEVIYSLSTSVYFRAEEGGQP